MRSYSLLAPAKINLYLEILGDRADGYHELAMVLQSIDLCDRIELYANGTDTIRIHCDHAQVPLDKSNLAYRAAELMTTQFPKVFAKFGGVDIEIDKRIPVAAGLAGGSTDAAAVIVGIDLMWQLGLTQSELQELAAQLGSDIPFCIAGGTAIATGRGEKLSPLPDLDQVYVVLAKYRDLAVSTAWAYQTYRQQFNSSYLVDTTSLEARATQVHSGPLVNAIAHKDNTKIAQLLHNDLEKVVLPKYPQVQQLREAFAAAGVLGTMMSGSGPTVFALTETRTQAEAVQKQVEAAMNQPNLEFWLAQFTHNGIHIEH